MTSTLYYQPTADSTAPSAEYGRIIAGWRRQFLETMLDWADAIEHKDPYTAGHARRVTSYSLLLGMELSLAQDELADLWLAAALHDVGKICVSDEVLCKPGPLTPEETAAMKAHPVVGARLLAPVRCMRQAVGGVRHHHERYDGRGYPDGLQGMEIPLPARIIAVADSFDAITTRRPYRDARSPEQAAREIRGGEGTQFCPSVVRAFQNLFDSQAFTV
jgi:HD-GYP domain-containing protein (c-di-GMP phosphodiesterase class II)